MNLHSFIVLDLKHIVLDRLCSNQQIRHFEITHPGTQDLCWNAHVQISDQTKTKTQILVIHIDTDYP